MNHNIYPRRRLLSGEQRSSWLPSFANGSVHLSTTCRRKVYVLSLKIWI